jgi:hypothetical protein
MVCNRRMLLVSFPSMNLLYFDKNCNRLILIENVGRMERWEHWAAFTYDPNILWYQLYFNIAIVCLWVRRLHVCCCAQR